LSLKICHVEEVKTPLIKYRSPPFLAVIPLGLLRQETSNDNYGYAAERLAPVEVGPQHCDQPMGVRPREETEAAQPRASGVVRTSLSGIAGIDYRERRDESTQLLP